MNRYELICEYCDNRWQINYTPKEQIYCSVCNDRKIRVRDLHAENVDYYFGAPPFEEPEDDSTSWNF